MKTILAVDDSATMREMVAFVLESAGYRVIEAEDGAQGLDRATSTNVDLVITDQNMPNMDGLTLVRSLRELRDYKSIPILLLTTESSDSMKAQGGGRDRVAGEAVRPATSWSSRSFASAPNGHRPQLAPPRRGARHPSRSRRAIKSARPPTRAQRDPFAPPTRSGVAAPSASRSYRSHPSGDRRAAQGRRPGRRLDGSPVAVATSGAPATRAAKVARPGDGRSCARRSSGLRHASRELRPARVRGPGRNRRSEGRAPEESFSATTRSPRPRSRPGVRTRRRRPRRRGRGGGAAPPPSTSAAGTGGRTAAGDAPRSAWAWEDPVNPWASPDAQAMMRTGQARQGAGTSTRHSPPRRQHATAAGGDVSMMPCIRSAASRGSSPTWLAAGQEGELRPRADNLADGSRSA